MHEKTPSSNGGVFKISFFVFLQSLLLPFALFGQSNSGVWVTESSDGFTARAAFTAIDFGGKVYAMGGFKGATDFLNIVEVYDPLRNSWTTANYTGTFTPRRGLCSSIIDGKIYTFGGYNKDSTLNTLEVYDPVTNSWSTPKTSGTFTPRWRATSSVVDGKIYVIGGYNLSGGYLSSLEVFDPVANTWTTPSTTGTFAARTDHASIVVGGKIYVIGGDGDVGFNTMEMFDPSTNTWSTPVTSGTFTKRKGLTAVLLGDKIYAIGGYDGFNYLNTLEIFDPKTNSWSTPTTTGTFTARAGLSSAVVGGTIYVLGGNSKSGYMNTNEAYTPSASSVLAKRLEVSIDIYPNPSGGVLHVQSISQDIDHVIVYDILGAKRFDDSIRPASDFTLDLSTLPPGIYTAVFSGAGRTITKKIVRQ